MHAEFQPSRISAEISAELSAEILKAGFCICFGINYYMQNSADFSTDVPRVFWGEVGGMERGRPLDQNSACIILLRSR